MFQTEKMAETLSESEYSEWTLYLENSIDSEQESLHNTFIYICRFIYICTKNEKHKPL